MSVKFTAKSNEETSFVDQNLKNKFLFGSVSEKNAAAKSTQNFGFLGVLPLLRPHCNKIGVVGFLMINSIKYH